MDAAARGSGSGSGSSSMMGSCEEAELSKAVPPSRYESQKRRDWNTFGQYLKNQQPPLPLSRCGGAHVLEFLRYLDQFGKTKVHVPLCPFFGNPQPPAPCACPLRQAWGSLDALIGRLRAAFEENGGKPESNPFGTRPVRLFLREVREVQAKARGIAYQKKKRKRPSATAQPPGPELQPQPQSQPQLQPQPQLQLQLQQQPQLQVQAQPMRHHIEERERELDNEEQQRRQQYSNHLLSLPQHHHHHQHQHYQHQHFVTSIPSPSISPGNIPTML